MSGSLKQVLNCVEVLVKKMKQKRDLISNELNQRQCVSAKQMAVLLNTFVDQLLDDSEQQSELQLMACLAVDQLNNACGHKTIAKSTDQLKIEINSLENRLKSEEIECQRLRQQFDNCLKSLTEKEEEFKDEIKKYKKSEFDLKSKINELNTKLLKSNSIEDQIKREIKEELFKREFKSVITEDNTDDNIADEEVNRESGAEERPLTDIEDSETESEDMSLRQKCLNTKLSISLGNRVVDRNDSSDEESVINVSNMSGNRSSPKPKDKRKYLINRSRKGFTFYICNSFECEYSTPYMHVIRKHVRRCKTLTVIHCTDCDKRFTTKGGLNAHLKTKHNKSESVAKHRKRKYSSLTESSGRRSSLRSYRRSFNGQTVKPLIDLS